MSNIEVFTHPLRDHTSGPKQRMQTTDMREVESSCESASQGISYRTREVASRDPTTHWEDVRQVRGRSRHRHGSTLDLLKAISRFFLLDQNPAMAGHPA